MRLILEVWQYFPGFTKFNLCFLKLISWLPRSNKINVASLNSLWPCGTIWWHRCMPTLPLVKACCLWQHQVITSTNVDSSLEGSFDIHLRSILQEISQQPITIFSLKNIYLKFYSNLPGVNEWNDSMISALSHGNHSSVDYSSKSNRARSIFCSWHSLHGCKLIIHPVGQI